ncbi:MAG TPA: hypothetical protein VJ124_12175 [Pyrinomonadaceae bacterium]|nr:hypothetical protein [Pyrinomonadaceae bacterium]
MAKFNFFDGLGCPGNLTLQQPLHAADIPDGFLWQRTMQPTGKEDNRSGRMPVR